MNRFGREDRAHGLSMDDSNLTYEKAGRLYAHCICGVICSGWNGAQVAQSYLRHLEMAYA